jgi:putative membrane protein
VKYFLIRVMVNAIALAVATWLISGIYLRPDKLLVKIATLVLVAVIFGLINAFLKPVIKVIGCAFYILTLGLFALVVNGLLLWLTSWVAGLWHLPWHVAGFWPAFWGAIVIGVVSWLLGLFVDVDRVRSGHP